MYINMNENINKWAHNINVTTLLQGVPKKWCDIVRIIQNIASFLGTPGILQIGDSIDDNEPSVEPHLHDGPDESESGHDDIAGGDTGPRVGDVVR